MLTEKETRKMVQDVFNGKTTEDNLPVALFEDTVDQFTDAFENGWGSKPLTEPDIFSPDLDLFNSFQENIFYFSGNKTAKQVETLQGLIHKDDGTRRSFHEYKKEALKVDKAFNENHLESEFNTTIKLAESGKEWQLIQQQKASFPMLEFVAVMDDNTRKAHASLDGIKKPVDDEFWDMYSPPLDWQCRCTIRQHQVARPTDTTKLDLVEPPPGFRFNVLKARKLFDLEAHPYSILSKKGRAGVAKLVGGQIANGYSQKDEDVFLKTFKGSASEREWKEQQLHKHFPKVLKEVEAKAILTYTAESYHQINQQLWKNKDTDPTITANIKLMTSGLKKLPSVKGEFYRGTKLKDDVINKYKKHLKDGTDYVETSFFSSSTDSTVGSVFKTGKETDETRVTFLVDGKNGKDVGDVSAYGNHTGGNSENEHLFVPGTKWEVKDVQEIMKDDGQVDEYIIRLKER